MDSFYIWALSGRFCGKVIEDQVYDANGHHVGRVVDERIFSVKTGKVIGEFYSEERVGYKTNRSYPTRGSRMTRMSRTFMKRSNKTARHPAGWEDPKF